MCRPRLPSVRQKFVSAMQLVPPSPTQRLYTSIAPVMVTSSGEAPEAGDLGVVADLELQRRPSVAVIAGQEVHGVPRGRHLGIALRVGERVERRLDLIERGRRD